MTLDKKILSIGLATGVAVGMGALGYLVGKKASQETPKTIVIKEKDSNNDSKYTPVVDYVIGNVKIDDLNDDGKLKPGEEFYINVDGKWFKTRVPVELSKFDDFVNKEFYGKKTGEKGSVEYIGKVGKDNTYEKLDSFLEGLNKLPTTSLSAYIDLKNGASIVTEVNGKKYEFKPNLVIESYENKEKGLKLEELDNYIFYAKNGKENIIKLPNSYGINELTNPVDNTMEYRDYDIDSKNGYSEGDIVAKFKNGKLVDIKSIKSAKKLLNGLYELKLDHERILASGYTQYIPINNNAGPGKDLYFSDNTGAIKIVSSPIDGSVNNVIDSIQKVAQYNGEKGQGIISVVRYEPGNNSNLNIVGKYNNGIGIFTYDKKDNKVKKFYCNNEDSCNVIKKAIETKLNSINF